MFSAIRWKIFVQISPKSCIPINYFSEKQMVTTVECKANTREAQTGLQNSMGLKILDVYTPNMALAYMCNHNSLQTLKRTSCLYVL